MAAPRGLLLLLRLPRRTCCSSSDSVRSTHLCSKRTSALEAGRQAASGDEEGWAGSSGTQLERMNESESHEVPLIPSRLPTAALAPPPLPPPHISNSETASPLPSSDHCPCPPHISISDVRRGGFSVTAASVVASSVTVPKR